MNHIKQVLKAILRHIDDIFASIGSAIVKINRDNSKTPRPANQAKRLYIDATYIYSTNINTGIQRVVRNIIKHMEAHTHAKKIELIIAALVNGTFIKIEQQELETFQKQSSIANILQRVKRKIKLYGTSFFRGEILYEDDIVLMLDSSWHLHVWPSVDYARQRGTKIIGVTYDLIPITHPQFCDDVMEYYFTEWYRQSMLYFDGYIAISKTVMQDLIAYFEKKNAVMQRYAFDSFTLGADIDTDLANTETIRESLITLYQNRPSIYLTVSTIEPRKNHRFVYETFKKLWNNNLNTTWVIVGRSGWKTEALQQKMREDKAYQDKLWIFNDLSDTELHYCYQHSKALLFPSVIEGFGLPIIESLKNGLPVLASDIPIHREVGNEKIDYFDLSRSDSLRLLISDIEAGSRALKQIDTESIAIASWDESAKELLEKTIAISNHTKKVSSI